MKFTFTSDGRGMEEIPKRIDTLERWLAANAPQCEEEQKHLDEGTSERAYWNYGYLAALRDVLHLIERQR